MNITTNPNLQNRYYLMNSFERYPVSYMEPQREELSDDTKSILTFGILQAMAGLLQKASKWCGQKLMQGKEFSTETNVNQIANSMLADNDLKGKIAVEFINKQNIKKIASRYSKGGNILNELIPVANGENAFYADSLKLAVAPKNKPSLILHELGHAITAHKGKFMRFMQKSRGKIANLPPALLLINHFLKKDTGEKTFIDKYAGLIGFGAFLPTILEEGLASIRGIKAAGKFKKTVDSSINLKPLKRNYGFAWLTYLIAGVLFGISTKIGIMDGRNHQ